MFVQPHFLFAEKLSDIFFIFVININNIQKIWYIYRKLADKYTGGAGKTRGKIALPREFERRSNADRRIRKSAKILKNKDFLPPQIPS